MKTEIKIVRLFIESKTPKTIREIAHQIKADYKITHTAIQKLIQQKVISVQTVGKSSLCRLDDSYYGLEIYDAETQRKQDMLKNSNVKQLYKEFMSKTPTSFFIMLLFGSYAKRKQTKSSDIDLLCI